MNEASPPTLAYGACQRGARTHRTGEGEEKNGEGSGRRELWAWVRAQVWSGNQ